MNKTERRWQQRIISHGFILCNHFFNFLGVVETVCENDLTWTEGIFRYFFYCRYDAEAAYFDEGVRSAKQKQLQEKMFQVILLNSVLGQSWLFEHFFRVNINELVIFKREIKIGDIEIRLII